MDPTIIGEWALIAIIFASAVGYSYLLGDYFVRAGILLLGWKRIPTLRKWGVDRDLFFPRPLWGFISSAILIAIFAAFLFLVAAAILGILIDETLFTAEVWEKIFFIAVIPFALGGCLAYARIWNILTKIDKLTRLPKHFHQQFSKTELLSMYEALRFAPPIFWEEYANLSIDQISYEMNHQYRESAAPFRHSSTTINNNTMLVVGFAVLVVTIASLILSAAVDANELSSLLDKISG